VLLGVLTLSALAVGAAVWGYFTFLRYDRVAARHLPADTVAAARVDVEEGILYDPVRQHLVPVLMDSMHAEADEAFVKRFEAATGLERTDLREIVVARGPDWTDWTLVVNGLFPKSDVVDRLEAFLNAEQVTGWHRSPDGAALVHDVLGAAMGQADDGAIIVAASLGRLASALPPQDTAQRIGLDVEAPAALSASAAPLRALASHPAALLAPGLGELDRVARVRATVTLGDQLELRFFLDPQPGALLPDMRAGVERLLGGLRFLARMLPQDVAGERTLLERAVVEPLDGQSVVISATWTRDEADHGAQSLATALRGWLSLPARPRP
jgi:hypothetical protein